MVGNLANAGDTGSVEDNAGSSSFVAPVRVPPPTAEQSCWDGKDAQAHALLAYLLSVPLSHIFVLARHLKMLGMYLPHCIRQGMRLVLLISVTSWRVSI